MNDTTATPAAAEIGFVSLGCPKALTDSELIPDPALGRGLHQQDLRGRRPRDRQHLRLHRRRRQESLDTIGEALAENGKVIVTGCLGAKTGAGGDNLVKAIPPACWPSRARMPRRR